MVLCAFLACKNTEQSSNVYVPSEEILAALEKGEDGLKVCETVQDSFYVGLEMAKEGLTSFDTILSVEKFRLNDSLIFDDINLNLKADYYLQKYNLKKRLNSNDKILEEGFLQLGGIQGLIPDTKNFYLKYCDSFKFSSEKEISPVIQKLYAQIPTDSISDLAELNLISAYYLRNKMLFEESLDKALLAVQYFEKDSLLALKNARGLELIAGIFYDMEEYESSKNYYKAANRKYKEQVKKENELERFLFNYTLLMVNHEEKDIAKEFIEAYGNEFDNVISDFNYNFLNGILNYNDYNDLKALDFYSKAMKMSKNFPQVISSDKWLDVRVQSIASLEYLNRFDDAKNIIEEIREKNPNLDSISIFDNFLLVQAKERELSVETQLAINSQNDQVINEVLKMIDSFLQNLELSNLIRRPKNVYHIYNNFGEIYDLKFKLLLELYEKYPEQNYGNLIFFEVEKLKAKEQFLLKISQGNEGYQSLLNLLQSELKFSLENTYPNKYQVILETIRKDYPDYWRVYHQGQESFIKEAMSFCRANESQVLEYYLGSTGFVIGFLVSEDGVSMKPLEDVRAVFGTSNMYGRSLDPDSIQVFENISQKIQETIYTPFEPMIDQDRIIIISDGLVDNVSFDSFKIGDKYLVEEKEIGFAYSLKSLIINDLMGKIDFENQSIIAYSYTDSETINSLNHNGLNELIGAYTECISLQSKYPKQVTVVSGGDATKSHFLGNAFDYNIVHLALHGKGQDNSIRNNKLFFRSDSKNEYLERKDFSNMHNDKTKLLVLNACEINNARDIINEGNFSMAKQFANLGIQFVISSSWEIDDSSSVELFSTFYNNLSKFKDPLRALSSAKRTFLKNNINSKKKHPFYWSALKLYIS